ncbi:alpha-L-arabinofuranosidase C-terminal domain-containing protein [Aquabacterium humicola]|uniref:alpha-L-arabinofuranosidase C-terminal domain-containing protein n=1 Tax=Aquabacterium humicola TaxID=3237377 RepID=UPI002542E4CA|nr:alpha-L-arabinofuranosidase C-terminal domain-containing protein [Rubrivivax pictus]
MKKTLTTLILAGSCGAVALHAGAQSAAALPTIRVAADREQARISPMLYGLMTEEINFAYEGGLYGELIRNRSFKAEAGYAYQAEEPVYWSTVGAAGIALDRKQPLNEALDLSLVLTIPTASAAQPAGIRNGGWWGIGLRPDTEYRVSFHAKAEADPGPLTLALAKADGTTLASSTVGGVGAEWQRFELTLRTDAALAPSKDNVFTLTAARPGKLWLQQVSLFGPTHKNRRHGLRPDLMALLAGLKPKFLRFPGGNYVEGDTFAQRFDWRKTVGDPARRPGHRSPWNYWSTDGMGLLEFLLWCEDLQMEPLLNVFAGYALNGERLSTAEELAPYVQEALDQIEYIIGDTGTIWGAQRARDGHPAPFRLRTVEIGNEDFFDKSGSYDRRFSIFYQAIKAKYPQLQLVSTMAREATPSQRPDLVDEHTYAWGEAMMYERLNDYDARPRSGPKVFVGEWATHEGWPMPNMLAAIADAAYLTSLERNADLVAMSAYAPLLANVSQVTGHSRERSMQWSTNLIGYDALRSYGTPSYYVQKMFSESLGEVVLASSGRDIPTWSSKENKTFPSLHWVATRKDSATGGSRIQLKLASRSATAQPVRIQLDGLKTLAGTGTLTVLSSPDPAAGNSLDEPTRIAPKTQVLEGIARAFTLTLPAWSVAVLELEGR